MLYQLIKYLKSNYLRILILIGAIILILVESNVKGDFEIYLNASKDLFEGNNIYTTWYHEWYHYYYDLLFAIIIYPLSILPIYWANSIWLAFNILLTRRIWFILKDYFNISNFNTKEKSLFSFLSFAFVFAIWHKNIHLAQITILILYLSLEGISQIQKNNKLSGSILLALGISIKIMPIVIIPYFIYKGEFKVFAYIILATITILVLPGIIIGYEQMLFLLSERWTLLNPINNKHILDIDERSFHSLTTLLSTLLIEDTKDNYTLDLKRNIADISLDSLKDIILYVRIFFISLTFLFLKSLPFQKSKSKSKLVELYELSYILLVTPLIFPHQQHYSFYFILPATTYLIYYSISTRKNKNTIYLFILLGIIFLLINSHFLLGEYRSLYDHYKTLTYGILLLIPLLAFAKPSKLKT